MKLGIASFFPMIWTYFENLKSKDVVGAINLTIENNEAIYVCFSSYFLLSNFLFFL